MSYSWTSPDHEAWVVQLATELSESGVDVILDKWNLKEGHDAYAFMEKMVNDPDIKKVAMICDQAYAVKADGRSGGVGVEAQIISPEVYERQAQDKFVAVVVERDREGRPFVPAYYKSRIHIDLSDPGSYAENFEKLLRWIYDKPLYRKPDLGNTPTFLDEAEGKVILATSVRLKRALEAVRGHKEYAIPATKEYMASLAQEFEKLRLDPNADPFDDAVMESIEAFLPYRNEAIELFHTLAMYLDGPETCRAVHRFFEDLIPYLTPPTHGGIQRECDADNFRFIIHELFLYALACLIRHERFAAAAYLMANEYYVADRSEHGRDTIVPYQSLRQYMKSLEHRNKRMGLRRLSLRADMLKKRCSGVDVEFRHLMQADFILFMRASLEGEDCRRRWWPETLIWLGHSTAPFEVFARAKSTAYFDEAKVLLGVDSKEDMRPLLESFAAGETQLPRWEFESFAPASLLGFNELCTKP